jgi:predicted glycosyltransferase
MRKPRILISPLDWGLGHATRCIPIIRELLKHDCDVWLAADGPVKKLLAQEFPQLTMLQLQGYNIRYSKSGKWLIFKIIRQLPKILNNIMSENLWLQTKMTEYEFDAVISDNRFGLRHKKAECIFITHQLSVKTGLGRFADWIAQWLNYGYIKKFDRCWVADKESAGNLAGELSHPKQKPNANIEYLGVLSRFDPADGAVTKNHFLVLLSGPEPQRTLLENDIIKNITDIKGSATVVRGLPAASEIIPSTSTVQFYNHLPSTELNREMQRAEFVISRCGYSTIMDIARLHKKSILIPTPGQPEQEYLASELMEKKLSLCMNQKEFSLNDALLKARNFQYSNFPASGDTDLKSVITAFVNRLERRIHQS